LEFLINLKRFYFGNILHDILSLDLISYPRWQRVHIKRGIFLAYRAKMASNPFSGFQWWYILMDKFRECEGLWLVFI
jgi:hypothetical protein